MSIAKIKFKSTPENFIVLKFNKYRYIVPPLNDFKLTSHYTDEPQQIGR